MNKYQIGLAAAVLAASFVNNANAATINNVASGKPCAALVGADGCRLASSVPISSSTPPTTVRIIWSST